MKPASRWAARMALLVTLATGLLLASGDPYKTLIFASYALVAAVLLIRRPRNAVSWILLGVAFGFTGIAKPADVDWGALSAGTSSWRDFAFAWSEGWWGHAGLLGFLVLTLVFPEGHLPHGRPRRVAIALVVLAVSSVVLAAFNPSLSVTVGGTTTITVPNRLGFLPSLPLWSVVTPDVTILVTIATVLAGTAWLVVRFRGASGVMRLQLRWLTAAIAFIAVAFVFGIGTLGVFGEDAWFAWFPALVAYPAVPVSIGIAVLRYRLYEIDRIISRTVGYAIVTAVLGGLFAGLVIGLRTLAAPLIGSSELAVALSTLAVVALFGPLRRRVQDLVDRRFDRARYDGIRVAENFGARLRDRLDLDDVSGELVSTAHAALRPASASLWLRARERS